VSCSDDDFVRIYKENPENGLLELDYTLNTHFITDWHTLTYLSLQPNGEHLGVVSENGYLFVWNLINKEMVFSSKIHSGSIEAMDWKGNLIVCCSSDCTFSVVNIQNK